MERIFISYSWDSEEHKDQVLSFVAFLRDNGFDATCDEAIMQKESAIHLDKMMVNNIQSSNKIIIILTPGYKHKADNNLGGIGKEYGYILSEITNKKNKYILVSFKNLNSKVIDEITPFGFKSREIIDLVVDGQNAFQRLFSKLSNQPFFNLPPVANINPKIEEKKIYNFDLNDVKNHQKDFNLCDEINKTIENFINVYANHGVPINKISAILPSKFGLRMKDFANKEAISSIIDNGLLEWTSSFFGVNIEWLYGTSESIYSSKSSMTIQDLFKLIVNIKFVQEKRLTTYLFKAGDLDCSSEKPQYLALLLKYESDKVANSLICRYIPIGVEWNWGYWKSRYNIKHVIYFLEKLKITPNGYDVSPATISSLVSGSLFPEKVLKDQKMGYTWYPEDYIDLQSESCCAKEIQETQKVREDFYERRYKEFLNTELDKISNVHQREYVKRAVMPNF